MLNASPWNSATMLNALVRRSMPRCSASMIVRKHTTQAVNQKQDTITCLSFTFFLCLYHINSMQQTIKYIIYTQNSQSSSIGRAPNFLLRAQGSNPIRNVNFFIYDLSSCILKSTSRWIITVMDCRLLQ